MLDPLYIVISFVLLRFHDLFSFVLDPDAGITWALSIMLLVVTMRAILFPLFVKQIKAQRRMQLIQPQMKELKEKHKGDRETLNREMQALMKDNNANPLSGCLPLLVQIPVFISLFHVLRILEPGAEPHYGWTQAQVDSAASAKVFGAPISLAFTASAEELATLEASQLNVRIVTGLFIIFMAVTTFLTQRQMLARSKATSEAQVQNVQKAMMYIIPVSLTVSGPFFPLGVLLYWTTTNLFSLGQQQYVIRTMHQHEEQKRVAQMEAKQNPSVQGPRPGAKPVNPRKGGGGGTGGPAGTKASDNSAPKKGTSGSKGTSKGTSGGGQSGSGGGSGSSGGSGSPGGSGKGAKGSGGKRPPGSSKDKGKGKT